MNPRKELLWGLLWVPKIDRGPSLHKAGAKINVARPADSGTASLQAFDRKGFPKEIPLRVHVPKEGSFKGSFKGYHRV